MKEILISILVVAVLVGGIWFAVNLYLPPTQVRISEPEKTEEAAERAKPPAKRLNKRIAAVIEPAEVTEVPPQFLAEPPAPLNEVIRPPEQPEAPAPRPFNPVAVKQIKVGMDDDQVVDLLGAPTLRTVTTDRGSLNETYVYKGTAGLKQVTIHLSDGKVVAPER